MTEKLEYLEVLVAKTRHDQLLARAIETIVGGSPTGVLEEADLAMVDAYIEAHGVDHFLCHVQRHHEHLTSIAKEVQMRQEEDARVAIQESEARKHFDHLHRERTEEERRKRAARLASLGLPPDPEIAPEPEQTPEAASIPSAGSPDEPVSKPVAKKGKKK